MIHHPAAAFSLKDALVITGTDARSFLQGLITNDMAHLETSSALYGCLLTPQGKFLYDLIIYIKDDKYIIDYKEYSDDVKLIDILERYRLRASANITAKNIYVYCGTGPIPIHLADKGIVAADPRHPDMGWRVIMNTPLLESDIPPGVYTEAAHRQREIECGIPNAGDADIGVSTPEEMNIPRLNGVSYTKGCYLGQEMTARMEHRGLAKRHLVRVRYTSPSSPDHQITDIMIGDDIAGKARPRHGDIGLALIRDDVAQKSVKPDGWIHLAETISGYQII